MSDKTGSDTDIARAGRRAALMLVGVGLFWILVTAIGQEYGWSQRLRALFDLAALAGFGWCLWAVWNVWRKSRAS